MVCLMTVCTPCKYAHHHHKLPAFTYLHADIYRRFPIGRLPLGDVGEIGHTCDG